MELGPDVVETVVVAEERPGSRGSEGLVRPERYIAAT